MPNSELHDPVRQPEHEHEQSEHDVVEGRVIGERERAEIVALRNGEAVVAAPVAQALGEVIDHLRERERHHDELEAARAQRQAADGSANSIETRMASGHATNALVTP